MVVKAILMASGLKIALAFLQDKLISPYSPDEFGEKTS
jgi:hypothetical protein